MVASFKMGVAEHYMVMKSSTFAVLHQGLFGRDLPGGRSEPALGR
jgi:hypothetical protein